MKSKQSAVLPTEQGSENAGIILMLLHKQLRYVCMTQEPALVTITQKERADVTDNRAGQQGRGQRQAINKAVWRSMANKEDGNEAYTIRQVPVCVEAIL